MKRCLAFVLGGGGARGAMQVGAIRALIEAGVYPDLLVGTSIGAVNAAGLAVWGVNRAGIEALEKAFHEVAEANLMDARLSRFTFLALSGRPNHYASRRVAEFLISKGISPDLRFNQIESVRLALIGSNLDTGKPVIYGKEPGESVLEGLMASIALPPWFAPVEKDGQFIMDGGALSNLPIEPALVMGATEIIALDLDDPRVFPGSNNQMNQYLGRLVYGLSRRHINLETTLAEMRGVPVHHVELRSSEAIPIWDFSKSRELIQTGYEITSQAIWHLNLSNCLESAHPTMVSA